MSILPQIPYDAPLCQEKKNEQMAKANEPFIRHR
jgi:hypothetical protein